MALVRFVFGVLTFIIAVLVIRFVLGVVGFLLSLLWAAIVVGFLLLVGYLIYKILTPRDTVHS
jgi:hypothetical protein